MARKDQGKSKHQGTEDQGRFSPAPSKDTAWTGVVANDGCARSRPILHAHHDEKWVTRTLETNKRSANSTPCGPFSFMGGDFRDPLSFWEFCCLKHGLAGTQTCRIQPAESQDHTLRARAEQFKIHSCLVVCDNAMWAFWFTFLLLWCYKQRNIKAVGGGYASEVFRGRSGGPRDIRDVPA